MKIGLDVHGVVDKFPKFFSEFTKLFLEAGHEIFIITGVTLKQSTPRGAENLRVIKEDLNLHFTEIVSIIDYHESIGTEIVYADSENPWMDGELWDKCKGEYCKKHKIDIMLDDTLRYSKHFETPFVCFQAIVPEKS